MTRTETRWLVLYPDKWLDVYLPKDTTQVAIDAEGGALVGFTRPADSNWYERGEEPLIQLRVDAGAAEVGVRLTISREGR